MRAWPISLFLLCAVSLSSAPAQGISLWYNGDALGPPDYDMLRGSDHCFYNDFNVGPSGWNVEEVWGIYALKPGYPVATAASWEIRSGMSDGNAGTLVASGEGPLTRTEIGEDSWHYFLNRMAVPGLSVNLAPGSYWLGMTLNYQDITWLARTRGTNAIGSPAGNNGNTCEKWFNGYRIVSVDHSMGVGGSEAAEPIPEPTSVALLGLGFGVLVLGAARGRMT